jgi:hypothetical protein
MIFDCGESFISLRVLRAAANLTARRAASVGLSEARNLPRQQSMRQLGEGVVPAFEALCVMACVAPGVG